MQESCDFYPQLSVCTWRLPQAHEILQLHFCLIAEKHLHKQPPYAFLPLDTGLISLAVVMVGTYNHRLVALSLIIAVLPHTLLSISLGE